MLIAIDVETQFGNLLYRLTFTLIFVYTIITKGLRSNHKCTCECSIFDVNFFFDVTCLYVTYYGNWLPEIYWYGSIGVHVRPGCNYARRLRHLPLQALCAKFYGEDWLQYLHPQFMIVLCSPKLNMHLSIAYYLITYKNTYEAYSGIKGHLNIPHFTIGGRFHCSVCFNAVVYDGIQW